MKIARFSHDDAIMYGIIDDRELVVLAGDPMFSGYETTGARVPLTEVTLLAPVIPRSKVVCVGKNYHDHAAEMGGVAPEEPLLFLKPNTAVIGPDDAIVRPVALSERTEYEGELVVVIGRIAKNVKAENALDHVLGYTIGNDVTARDLQRKDGQWSRAKGFDTFCPLGPVIETDFDPAQATIETRVNGEVRQHAPLTDMIHSVAAIIEYASAVFTLLPGDVIMTGTPAGVGTFEAGDTVEVEISGLGILRNTARDAAPTS
ncbi:MULTISPECIES: fumarylacetoacetate hydrolase family protein [Microbacterium]|jgi:2-keto-4-pentenoate hydratase/2-oxohepta-3-ene-1,7-dioic acid hydratase in catechol pathway|uniref:2-keto-4-pentenoate hydratase/2-oxohepta-3-ene-1,7-dioic acid hydratase (Catechol pathway) n=1 Tax=Microbacterium paraoxydans TaxID=199592 RepID=A0A1H1LI60_9MICO|nr:MULTISPECIES: fumarylacetoacetate hydrolase family protein [Microbacterium]MCK2031471.1 fumarylacetoacetate hydrolase family protein [Microbacterium sp. KSW4-4]MCT2225170.1 fumarylacetoacetate hydrolase family protein [Microbacterium paraoxydans]SDR74223.1 2-keto-4-pentenoate hydratase/2-oxohepta-3-ene-1,7-dioic acid hydratase (catechol pathway) [Microbacterium paraoxydans]